MVFSPIQHHGNQLVRHLMASKPAAWPLQRAIKRIQAGYHTTPWLDPVDPKRHRKRANFHGKIWGNGQGKFGLDKFVNVTNHFYGNVGSFNYDNIPGRWGVDIYEDEIWSDGKEGWVKLCLKKKGWWSTKHDQTLMFLSLVFEVELWYILHACPVGGYSWLSLVPL